MPVEAPSRQDFATDTAAAIANSALIAATASPGPAGGKSWAVGGSVCSKGEEARNNAPSHKVEVGGGIPTGPRPLAACENLVVAVSTGFSEHDVAKSSSSTSIQKDGDKENRFSERSEPS